MIGFLFSILGFFVYSAIILLIGISLTFISLIYCKDSEYKRIITNTEAARRGNKKC